jgi:hypothetical protein
MLRRVKGLYTNSRNALDVFRSRWVRPYLSLSRLRCAVPLYRQFLADWTDYEGLPDAEPLRFADSWPCLFDRTDATAVDDHYFYQGIWAFKRIQASGVHGHVDVGSRATWVGLLSTITQVTFVDIRPLVVNLEDYSALSASIMDLPFPADSVSSLSCLHVAEHVGLGRYGDSLAPAGTYKAARELARVLAPWGNLYFSVPVGRPRVCFNAHRVHSPAQILEFFHDLQLIEFSSIDGGMCRRDIAPNSLSDAEYACGLFHFAKNV